MRTPLRRIGNSQGVLIPAHLLAECGLSGEIELHVEEGRIVIEPVRTWRAGWFDAYRAENDSDVWKTLPLDTDDAGDGDWQW